MLVPLHQNNTTSRCLARSTVCFEIVTLNDSPAMRPLRPKRVLYNRTYGSYFFAPVFDMQKGISVQYQNIILEDCGDAHTHTHTYTLHNKERWLLGWISTPFQLQHGFFLTQIACPNANALLFVLSFPRTSMIFSITLAASTMLPWYISRFYIHLIWVLFSNLLLNEKM